MLTFRVTQIPWRILLSLSFVISVVGFVISSEIRAVEGSNASSSLDRGEAVLPAAAVVDTDLQRLDGFIVWSSNRSGNHDIYLKRLPNGVIQRITNHPHTEFYPRISPDGKQIVFSRSHKPSVSQRNIYPWDVYLLDLKSGKERLLAKNGNLPTWSIDGKRVFFQRHGNTVVELNLRKNREKILYQSGQNIKVPPKTALGTPSISAKGDRLAATFRNTMRATGVVGPKGRVRRTGKGCQLNWGPGDRYLYKIDDGGKMKNALYKINAKTLAATKWFDAQGDYSHEYFPRISNTDDVLVYGASSGGHEHDTADYEIFLWVVGEPANKVKRITYHAGNDCWPDVYLYKPVS